MGNDRGVWGVSSGRRAAPLQIHPPRAPKTHEHSHVLTQTHTHTHTHSFPIVHFPAPRPTYQPHRLLPRHHPQAQNRDSLYVQPAVISSMEYMAPKAHQKKNKKKANATHLGRGLRRGPWPQWQDPVTKYLLLTDLPGSRFSPESPISYILLGMPHQRSLPACSPQLHS